MNNKTELLLQLLRALEDEETAQSFREFLYTRAMETAIGREQLRELTRTDIE